MYNYKLFIGVLFNTNLCHHHAKIFISSKSEGLFQCTGINYLPRGKNPYHSGINTIYTAVYRSVPFVQAILIWNLNSSGKKWYTIYTAAVYPYRVPVGKKNSVETVWKQCGWKVERCSNSVETVWTQKGRGVWSRILFISI
jgi:hypothetical protein